MANATVEPRSARELRVLVCAALQRDAELTCECLADARIETLRCDDDDALFEGLAAGAGAVILSEERLGPSLLARLRTYLDRQPAWSDLPLVVMVSQSNGVDFILETLHPLGNVTAIERPTRRRALIGVVRAAVRARERQYEARALLARLSESDRRKDAFIAMLGHELRNPLAAIHGAATLLDALPDKNERVRRVAEILGRQVGHLQHLVDDLLDVARITAGKIALKRQHVEVGRAARQVVTMLEHAAREHAHRVELTVSQKDVVVDADPVRLEQMIGNLLHNAIKYTQDGGHIRVLVEGDETHARVRVIDDGQGLAPESLEHIFEPFNQVDSSLDRSAGGLGLGLPLVRGLASLHGGAVEARSGGLGLGSEFVIVLPRVDTGRASFEIAREVDVHDAPRGLRVLLVDDFLDVLDVLRLGLEQLGCIVDTATDGMSAVERARSGVYDVAFVDIGLPEIDGLEVARILRSDSRASKLPLVAMSGYGRTEDKQRSAAAGFDRHLVKPVDAAQLLRTAEEILGMPSAPPASARARTD